MCNSNTRWYYRVVNLVIINLMIYHFIEISDSLDKI